MKINTNTSMKYDEPFFPNLYFKKSTEFHQRKLTRTIHRPDFSRFSHIIITTMIIDSKKERDKPVANC